MLQGGLDRAIAKYLAFACKAKDVGHKELGYGFFIALQLHRTIKPRPGGADGGFGFADDQRNAVDEQHMIKTFFDGGRLESDFFGDDEAVVIEVIVIYEPDGDVLVVAARAGAKGHGDVVVQPFGHHLVGADEAIGLYRKQDGTQAVDDFIGTRRLGGDVRVETLQGGGEFVQEEDIANGAVEVNGFDFAPA